MEVPVKVAKWGNSLAVRIPKDVAEALGLSEGSEVKLVALKDELGLVRQMTRDEAIESLRQFRGLLPADYKFDREEANAR
jgi:antitoxin MazE